MTSRTKLMEALQECSDDDIRTVVSVLVEARAMALSYSSCLHNQEEDLERQSSDARKLIRVVDRVIGESKQ